MLPILAEEEGTEVGEGNRVQEGSNEEETVSNDDMEYYIIVLHHDIESYRWSLRSQLMNIADCCDHTEGLVNNCYFCLCSSVQTWKSMEVPRWLSRHWTHGRIQRRAVGDRTRAWCDDRE